MARVKKGDTVYVISGKDKGKTGTVLAVLPESETVVVEGVNLVTKHQRPTQRSEGKRFKKEAPLHLSKVMPVDPTNGKPTRVRHRIEGDVKVRVAKSGAVLDKTS